MFYYFVRVTKSTKMRYNYTGILLLFACVLSLFASEAVSSPVVLWSQKSHIWSKLRGIRDDFDNWVENGSAPVDTVQSRTVENGAFYSLGYDPVSDDLYWNDKVEHTIYRQARTSSFKEATYNVGIKKLFSAGTESEIDGIAVDWLTQMVYFTDFKKRWVGVVASGSRTADMYRILFHTDLGDPKGITLDPFEGLLFWADPVKGRIERSTLAGSKRQEVVSGMTTKGPRGVTADLREKRIYWVDRDLGTIESASYSGSDRRLHFSAGGVTTYLGIATSKDYIFVATDTTLTLDVHDKTRGNRLVQWDIDATIYDVIVLDTSTGPVKHDCVDKECEQLCLNTGHGKGVCACVEGYYLDTDGTSCIESKPRYIYSVGDAILSADVTIDDRIPRLTNERRVIDKVNKVQALGFHFDNHLLYFSDTDRDVIYRGDPDVGKWTEHTVGTRQVEGVSVDWVSGNVYWTDATLGHIMVSRLDGRYHRILLSSAGQPKGVSADPTNRWLFWSERTKGEIRRSRMDGSDSITLIKDDLTSPQGLVVDPRMKRLYWVNTDATKLEYTDFDGKHRAVAIKATGSSLYDVTVFQEYATWTDGKNGIRVGLGTTGEVMNKSVFTNSSVSQAYDVVTYDPYLQPRTTSVCNGDSGCEQLCFPSTRGHTCRCAIGFTLNADGKSCDSDVTDQFFVLFPDPYHKQVYQLSITATKGQPNGVKLPLAAFPVSVDYDRVLAMFYWLDRGAGQIKMSSAHGTHEKILLRVSDDMYPQRISVNPLTNQLYYTDSKKGAIFRIALLDDNSDPELIVSGLSQPFAIFVDYDNSLLYWSSLEPSGKIEVSKLDGKDRRVVVNDTMEPTGIAVQHGGGMLYYGDRQQRRVVAVNVTTGKRDIVFNGTDEEIYALAATDNYIYFTAWNKKAVYRLDINNDNDVTVVSEPIFARLTDIRVFEESLPSNLVQSLPGLDIFILIGLILAALFMLLFLLLAALLAARRCRRTPKHLEDGNDTATTSANSDTIDGPSDDWSGLETINHDMFEPLPECSPPITTYETVMAATDATCRNGAVASSRQAPLSADVTVSGISVSSPVSPAPAAGAAGAAGADGSADTPEVNNGRTDSMTVPLPIPIIVNYSKSQNGSVAPNGSVALNGSAAPTEVATDAAGGSGPKATDPPLKADFELPEDVQVATIIQRIVSRLRGGLASIRWNNPERPRIKTRPDAESDHHAGGRTAKDMAKRRRASMFPPEPEYTPPDPSAGQKPPQQSKDKKFYPSAPYRQPRGFAPASHYVPRAFKMSWGRNSRKNNE